MATIKARSTCLLNIPINIPTPNKFHTEKYSPNPLPHDADFGFDIGITQDKSRLEIDALFAAVYHTTVAQLDSFAAQAGVLPLCEVAQ
jgi:hypothetical protein